MTFITVDDFLPSIEQVLQEVRDEIGDAFPGTPVDASLKELRDVLQKRGSSYGENFPYEVGEPGIYYLALTKLLRLRWALRFGLDTREHWLDLAGYGVLQMSAEDYRTVLAGTAPRPAERKQEVSVGFPSPLAYIAGPITENPNLARARESMLYPSINSAGVNVYKPYHAFSLLDDENAGDVAVAQEINDVAVRQSSVIVVGVYGSGETNRSAGTLHEMHIAHQLNIPLLLVWLESTSPSEDVVSDLLNAADIKLGVEEYYVGKGIVPGDVVLCNLYNYPEACAEAVAGMRKAGA